MTLSDVGENELVAQLTRNLPLGAQVRAGAGDDCAVIGGKRDKLWRLLKTDAVVEGVHFLATDSMRRVGWKALCRNISDVAAMGGVPKEAVITVAATGKLEVAALKELYAGLRKAARAFGVSIVGGETSRSPGPLFVSVALTGEVERERCTFRSGGEVGDRLYVTGTLGGSRAKKHLDFVPRLTEARWLTEHFPVRAMMDLSDGLAADLPRLAKASGCGYELWRDELPITKGCTADAALNDGEDFELLFAMRKRDGIRLTKTWPRRFPSLRCIGQLAASSQTIQTHRGFDHFA